MGRKIDKEPKAGKWLMHLKETGSLELKTIDVD